MNINGTANINSNWCLGFNSSLTSAYTVTTGIQGGTAPTGSIGFSWDVCESTVKPTANLSANFKQPGDKIEYTLTILNKSSINAAIQSITVDGVSVTSNQAITKGNIKFIVEMPEATTLTSTTGSTTMKVTAEFKNDTDVTGRYTGETQSITVQINA